MDLDRVVDLVYDLLNEMDITDLAEMQYVDLVDFWCDQIWNHTTDEKELKKALKEYLKGEEL